ncbi:MAG: OB-fold nucleic acid binding domain-containing protein [Candidatus Bathyarchaeota archaeon]|nr:OB-fold nucleic acid binding domain-containing protein [Candidatus Bathyarchaeota archaeon]MDH5635368.1 OB-fold nucleic acid binding domain-containing protein [Candidatus Bathyarchaeota archaeon]
MGSEKIVEQILSSRPDLTRQEVHKMIEKKKEGVGEFFTDETAARIVASELGVEIVQKPLKLEILIQDLVSGLNDVTVAGRVVTVYPPKTFTRRDLTEGKFARLLIADRSGTLKVVLWDDKTDLVETGKFEQGQIIKVSHGYVREGLDGKLELHVGSRGNIQISPPDATETKYPPATRWIKKVVDVKEEGGPITVEGTISTTPTVRQVVTSRNEKVAVASFELRDDTGKIGVSAWRKLAEIVNGLAVGTRIKIKNAYVRKGFADQLELTSRSFTSIDILTEPET